WPRQSFFINLAGGTNRELIHHANAWNQCSRHGFSQAFFGCPVVKACLGVFQRDIADKHRFPSGGLVDSDGGVVDIRQSSDVGFDLSELNATATDFDLVIDTPDKVQTIFFQAHMVAGAVGTLPPDRRQRCIFFRVFFGIEVAGKTDSATYKLADFAGTNWVFLTIDDNEVPGI